MNPVTSSVSSQQTNGVPLRKCQQCGKMDKKLRRCAKCHIEPYCSRDCQLAAWPKHKLVCHANPKKQDSILDIREVAAWCGKNFGALRGFKTIDKDIRILSHTGGFAVFLPKEVWRSLDYEVFISFPEKEEASCWIAGSEFAFVKVDLKPSELEGSVKDYASEDLGVALQKIERFACKNFFENRQAYPESSYFTHGSVKDHPEMPLPIRFRLGGNFHYQF